MTNLKLSYNIGISPKEKKRKDYLDNIEITSHYSLQKNRVSQYYKAIRKFNTNRKLDKLIAHLKTNKKSNNDWIKRYESTYNCQNVLLQQGAEFKSARCRKRWCQNCNRQKSAKLYADYKETLLSMAEKQGLYFVTLTAPTCKQRQLKSTIERRIKAFQRIKNNIRMRYETKLNGFRKLEVTHNKNTNEYHPHFHFIVQGKREAYLLLALWLDQFGEAYFKAQDVQRINIDANNTKALAEVFKYATKGAIKDELDAEAEHTIQKAILGKRIYQTYGALYNVKSHELEETEKNTFDWLPNVDFEIYKFDMNLKDWSSADGKQICYTQEIETIIQNEREIRKKEPTNIC